MKPPTKGRKQVSLSHSLPEGAPHSPSISEVRNASSALQACEPFSEAERVAEKKRKMRSRLEKCFIRDEVPGGRILSASLLRVKRKRHLRNAAAQLSPEHEAIMGEIAWAERRRVEIKR
uniref:Uncharacterized protein n=1 Tax=Chromera velia CCMP2878 TaxID=1169474 RepID=A0A0G4I1N9_9ALVE|eukprot:Cvel_34768.t1-p1 / transcript=Cvel_34768.t1 / gene=Cvel_34768 / organism=Chromera_velia_CCMP2878 / gene_product=hypothetical protein / transcript_product=hypothetical protein / location=Cvel_scaffold6079:2410-3121(+) / protein_length=118 / sequence_SO=supercontig / SO=protein_coding / is_pseudo=false